ncbi:hypothetical protein SNE40_010712 [Patella caerulea]|uniref:PiggyBac transposable element-derived protein domain-containing protein n=1 Tax=Patella caerulea TaxID=87958 RepID=A0AAN8K2G8_PATCE
MSRARFLPLLWNLHMSDPEEDEENQRRKQNGDPRYDPLGKLKPLYSQIQLACQSFYVPNREISIDERMVGSKARIGIKQYMKDKPVKWGYKLFVLADSATGYTSVYLIFILVRILRILEMVLRMTLFLNLSRIFLAKLFVDNFYTGATLFQDLLFHRTLACGAIRENRKGFPKSKLNYSLKGAKRGSIRWIRDNNLLFLRWKDNRDVTMCSTFHNAASSDSVKRKTKNSQTGKFETIDIPFPPSVKEYNKFMGGVDLSDQLIQYYQVLRKTRKWYKTLFLHCIDIAVVNSYIIHCQMKKNMNQPTLSQLEFRRAVVNELVHEQFLEPTPLMCSQALQPAQHLPVEIAKDINSLADNTKATKGRQNCKMCWTSLKKEVKTPWKCSACHVALCVIPGRNCFNTWRN